MDKPYFYISSTSGETQVLIDRRRMQDCETKAMRDRLAATGCVIKEITQEERDKLMIDDSWI